MPRNIPEFDALAEIVEQHPDQYDQTAYAIQTDCGTAYCLAGWVATLHGCHPSEFNPLSRQAGGSWLGPAGGPVSLETFAGEALGLRPAEAGALFSPDWGSGLPRAWVPAAVRAIARGASIRFAGDPDYWVETAAGPVYQPPRF